MPDVWVFQHEAILPFLVDTDQVSYNLSLLRSEILPIWLLIYLQIPCLQLNFHLIVYIFSHLCQSNDVIISNKWVNKSDIKLFLLKMYVFWSFQFLY